MTTTEHSPSKMKVILITGMSGSGKSVALRALEDSDFYCLDNLPPSFIPSVIDRLKTEGRSKVAVAVDARTGIDIVAVPKIVTDLRSQGTDTRIIFLDADDEAIVTRYSETRRRHPMSARQGESATVQECIQAEREAIGDIRPLADLIDTTDLLPTTLRRWVLETVNEKYAKLTLIFETFGFKTGLPNDADLVFDARCLANPYYDKNLRPLTGKDLPVQQYIQNDKRSDELLSDIENYLRKWLPSYQTEQRSYVTVAIGCTGGQHRSVYLAEVLFQRLKTKPIGSVENVLVRHRNVH